MELNPQKQRFRNMKNENNTKKNSKFLSLVLRHKPEVIGLSLDEAGWTYVEELLEKLNAYGKTIDRELLEYIVANNDKKRFEFSDDGLKIRASQGTFHFHRPRLRATNTPGNTFPWDDQPIFGTYFCFGAQKDETTPCAPKCR